MKIWLSVSNFGHNIVHDVGRFHIQSEGCTRPFRHTKRLRYHCAPRPLGANGGRIVHHRVATMLVTTGSSRLHAAASTTRLPFSRFCQYIHSLHELLVPSRLPSNFTPV